MEDSDGFFCSGAGCWLSLDETEDSEGFLRSCSVEGLWRRPWLAAGLSTGRREVGRGIPELGLGIPEGCSMLALALRGLSLSLSLSLFAGAAAVAGRAWCRRVAHAQPEDTLRRKACPQLQDNFAIRPWAAATASRVHTRV